ncbi:MAG TPA: NAD(P)-binding domain-containing protein, partial [Candidatus Acidoferrum sp.]|nr:NAD(P)-binding domain-containing protein [Candidatus Acidoferrum sp.]
MSDRDSVTVAIVGTGEMGAAVGRRLRESGARVATTLTGRSAESVARVRSADLEVIDDDDLLVRDANFVLSIVPPGVAVEIAERFRRPLARAQAKPV